VNCNLYIAMLFTFNHNSLNGNYRARYNHDCKINVQPFAVVTCPPDPVLNSSLSPDQAAYNYNTDVSYTCHTGFEHAGGNLTRTCQADGTWSGAAPTCSSMIAVLLECVQTLVQLMNVEPMLVAIDCVVPFLIGLTLYLCSQSIFLGVYR